MQKLRSILLFCFFAALLSAIWAQTPTKQQQKARYYYMEGAKQAALNNNDEAYELFKHAATLDPQNVILAKAYGESLVSFNFDDSVAVQKYEQVLSILKRNFDKYPENYADTEYYAWLATQLSRYDDAVEAYCKLDSIYPGKSEILINLSDVYYKSGDFRNAISTLDKYEKIEGKNGQTSITKALYHINLADTTSAVSEIDSLVSTNPTDPELNLIKGQFQFYLGQRDSAFATFKKAERLGPDNGHVKVALAGYYQLTGDSLAYDNKTYEALLCDNLGLDEKIDILVDYVSSLLANNISIERGNNLFTTLNEQYPHEESLLELSARYYATMGNTDAAIENISYAIDMNPQEINYWQQLMSYYNAIEQYQKTINTYNRSLGYIVPDVEMQYSVGGAYALSKDTKKAIETYSGIIHSINEQLPIADTVTDKTARDTLSYENLVTLSQCYSLNGDMFIEQGDTITGFKNYENAIFFFYENYVVANNYAYYLALQNKDLDKAETLILRALKKEPDNPTYLDTYAYVLFRKGDYKLAKVYIEAAMAKETSGELNADYYEHYGDILFMNDDVAKAVENWEKALDSAPENQLLLQKIEHRKYINK